MSNHKSITKSELLVYIFFIGIGLCKGFGLSGSNKMYICIYIFGTVLIAIKLLKDKLRLQELISIASLFLIGVIDFVLGKVTTILFTAISICCLKNIESKKIIKIIFWTRVISFLIMIFLSVTGAIENNFILHYRSGIGFIKRYCFGYSHPNLAHSTFSIIVILMGYLYYNRLNILNVTIVEILNYILYHFTLSRTGFLILTFYLIFIYFVKNNKIIRDLLPKFLKISMFFFIMISFFLAVGYTHFEFIKKLDILLTGRLNYMNILITNYTIPLIGSDFYNEVVLFDNGYFSLLYEGGILATIWFVYFQLKTNNYLIKHNMTSEIVLTLFLLFYCMFESYYISILMNPSLLLFTLSIYKSKTTLVNNKFIKKIVLKRNYSKLLETKNAL